MGCVVRKEGVAGHDVVLGCEGVGDGCCSRICWLFALFLAVVDLVVL